MPIIGVNIKSINAKVDDSKFTGNVEISSSPSIESVEKKDFSFAGMKDALFIGFSFKTQYTPDVGNIQFKGEIIYQSDDTKKVLKTWREDKKLDDDVSVEVLNAIFRKCIAKAVQIAEDLRLPPPINVPVVI